MKWLLMCSIACALGCEREPAIVIRFDAVDLAGHDLSRRPRDLGSPPDAAPAQEAKKSGPPPGLPKPNIKMECASEADCQLVRDGCCDCANGGKQASVRKGTALLDDRSCKDVMCTMMMSTDPSCGKRPACVDHQCVMRDARPDEIKPKLKKH